MSVFHRIDDIRSMPAPRFVSFALRLPAYKGVLRALFEAERAEEEAGNMPASARQSSRPSNDIRQNRVVPSDERTLTTDPAFVGFFEKKGA